MAVPEAAVHEYDFVAGWKYDVRRTGQVPAVKPEPVPNRMQIPPNQHLRLGVLATNPGHQCATLLGRHNIRHQSIPPSSRTAS
jgi:hypothetical protein